jgi:hypothetical protein
MPLRFTATVNAFTRGIESLTPAKAVQMIEDWESALSDVEIPGSKGIMRDLASLRRQLESGSPDGDRIAALLSRLGDATQRIADRADSSGDKLKTLGEAVANAGRPDTDEDDDDGDAAASPPRRRANA